MAREYEALKRTIAEQLLAGDPESQDRYAAAKAAFVERVVACAITLGYAADLAN